jgi:uncharacterized protein (DUF608 family)
MSHTTDLDRRRFLKLSAASTVASAFGLPDAQGEDAVANLYRRIVPTRKGLDKGWLESLARPNHPSGAPILGSKNNGTLDKIGMTVGGIGCGTVYLGGDGRLWVWDIFNQPHEGVVAHKADVPESMRTSTADLFQRPGKVRERNGANFIDPPTPDKFPPPFKQYLELRIGGKSRRFQASDWAEVDFDGRWPIGRVDYRDPSCPLHATIEAWSPFIPLHLADSSLPVTVIEITLRNPGANAVTATCLGVMENAVCLHSRARHRSGTPTTHTRHTADAALLCHGFQQSEPTKPKRKDIVFADFEGKDYGDWKTHGTAFGDGPIHKNDIPAHQGDLGMVGGGTANSHASAPGKDITEKDGATGTLVSPAFAIERKFIRFRIGGGRHKGKTCLNLIVDGKVVRSATGRNSNKMHEHAFDVSEFSGQKAHLELVDAASGAWGNTGLDHVVFSDVPPAGATKAEDEPDFGTMALGVLGEAKSGDDSLSASVTVPAGGETTVRFLLAWHFPNLAPLPGIGRRKRHYSKRFADAEEVAEYVAKHFDRLSEGTRDWVATYYDSTLPRWLLDRAALTTNTLQTSTCLIFEDGRFWAWEGIGCCPGTCAHVWHYAQGPARLFPEIERNLREITDFGIAQNPDGAIRFRAEANTFPAIDAQTGMVLRTWREHLCSPNASFLARVWPGAKRAIGWLIEFDRKARDGLDGLLDGKQHNTLDANWYGKVHCLCSLYLAALRAGEEMARTMGDTAFAAECRTTWKSGSKKIARLFNGEFYEQQEDPAHADAIGVGKGCYIDQVIGQWWATQVGLGRLYEAESIKSSLHALWKYNFVPDVGPFRHEFTRGRFYALPGDAGLVMCTWPNGGLKPDFKKHWQYGYFNECMTGFEWQAAAHMVMEGAPVSGGDFGKIIDDPTAPQSLTLRGLAVARAIHDRYSPAKRNPYNEIECSDHYARAAASWSLLLAVSGFQYDGPKGDLGFAPKLGPENFRCPFTAAEGWGTFEQKKEGGKWRVSITVRHGRLKLKRLRLPQLAEGRGLNLVPKWNDREISRAIAKDTMSFKEVLVLQKGDVLSLA